MERAVVVLNSEAEGKQLRLSDPSTSSVYMGWFGFRKEKKCSSSSGIDLDGLVVPMPLCNSLHRNKSDSVSWKFGS